MKLSIEPATHELAHHTALPRTVQVRSLVLLLVLGRIGGVLWQVPLSVEVYDRQQRVQRTWIIDVTRLGLLALFVIAIGVVIYVGWRASRPQEGSPDATPPEQTDHPDAERL